MILMAPIGRTNSSDNGNVHQDFVLTVEAVDNDCVVTSVRQTQSILVSSVSQRTSAETNAQYTVLDLLTPSCARLHHTAFSDVIGFGKLF